jgi:hypothetical protein
MFIDADNYHNSGISFQIIQISVLLRKKASVFSGNTR